ncbi:hypothetical protein, partial [Acinetobacter seifertii]|uniref:hypothetical protein n=1 Tax=Acinetobacter seifertii TaxID=1530123 RepID=UPI0035A258C5
CIRKVLFQQIGLFGICKLLACIIIFIGSNGKNKLKHPVFVTTEYKANFMPSIGNHHKIFEIIRNSYFY